MKIYVFKDPDGGFQPGQGSTALWLAYKNADRSGYICCADEEQRCVRRAIELLKAEKQNPTEYEVDV